MIKFGTSGWRALIAHDFTFDNVRLATQGIADFLKSERANVHNLEPEDLCALTLEAAAMAGVPLAGTSWIPGRGAF